MDAILALAAERNLSVIEDCAHAIETEYRGRPAGTMGDFGAFSFYPSKNITSSEGGMVIAAEAADIDTVKCRSHNGLSRDAWKRFSDSAFNHYLVTDCGYKYNMTDVQAAIGIHQLRRIESRWQRRRAIWLEYRERLARLPVQHPALPAAGDRHAFHLYSMLLNEEVVQGLGRDRLMASLQERGIGTGVHYLALTEHPYYQRALSWQPEDTPVATSAGRRTVSIPLSADLTGEEIDRITDALLRELG
jgi:dTDP-4-amino-4,6-dideoxygalactose transaminase